VGSFTSSILSVDSDSIALLLAGQVASCLDSIERERIEAVDDRLEVRGYRLAVVAEQVVAELAG